VTLAFVALIAPRLGVSVYAAQEREMRRALHELILNVNREIAAAVNVLITLRRPYTFDFLSYDRI
jgi:hypothetical protein